MYHPRKPLQLRPLVAATFVALTAMSGEVLAQAQPATNTQPDSASTATTDDKNGIREVVITARKRREKESDVADSVSVVGEQQLEDQHITQLTDLQGYLPSLQITSGGSPGQTTIALRGIPAVGPGAVVGTYIDETPLGSSSNFANASLFVLDLLPYDISQIELLRGPQGTLYGASAMGGLMKYVLTEPDLNEFSGRVGGGVSSIKGASGTGSDERFTVNVPLIQDQLAVRASFSNNQTPGWINNSLTGENGINSDQQQSARLALLWKPNDDLKLKLNVLHQSIDARDSTLVPLDPVTLAPQFGGNVTGKGIAEPFRKDVDFYSATLNWDLHWADFISASSYSKSTTNLTNDISPEYGPAFPLFGNFPVGLSALYDDFGLKKFTQEFRLASKQTGNLEWLVGAFYTTETSSQDEFLTAQTLSGAAIGGLDPLGAVDLPSTYKETALFVDLTYKFTDRFDLTGGLREAKNEQTFSQIVTAGSVLAPGTTSGTSSEEVTTYMFSPRFHITPDSMLYARVASGYRPGGPNVALPGVPPSVKSDTLVSDEIGLKSLFLEKRLSIDLAAYQIDWKNIQVGAVSASGINYLANGATAESRGIELSTVAKPTTALRFGFNASYTNAFLTADAPAINGLNGDKLGGIPHWIASLTSDYNFSLPDAWAGHVGAGYAWTGYEYMEVSGAPNNYRLPAVGYMNLNAEASKGIWTIRMYAKNLTNSQANTSMTAIQSAATGAVVQVDAIRPQPRTIGVEFDVAL